MQKKYDYMSFRQDLPGFGEPAEGSWDGWSRINTDLKNGGMIGLFRQGSKESTRRVFVTNLDPDKQYQILSAPEGTEVGRLSGRELSSVGFSLTLTDNYDGRLFEIRMLNQE